MRTMQRKNLFNPIALIGCLLFVLNSSAQQTPEKYVQETRYLLYLPDGYQKDTSQRWPLVLFLHGSGESGTDIEKVKVHGPAKLIESGKKFPFIVVSPQAEPGRGWQSELLVNMLADLKQKYRVDPDRVYLTGLSMGGYGTWNTAEKYPELFAAIAPICGGGDTAIAWRLSHTPIWCFHGAKDNVVPLSQSQAMVNAARPYSPSIKFTIYPEAGHDSWVEAYNNDSLYQWLLSHKRFQFKTIDLPETAMQQFTGRYVNHRNDTLTFSVENKQLKVLVDKSPLPLYPYTETGFFIEPSNYAKADFRKNKQGQVDGFWLYADERQFFRKLKSAPKLK